MIERRTVPSPSANGSERFSFLLPAFPWSASGTLVSIVWAVEASLDPGGEVAVARLVSGPNGVECRIGNAARSGDG